MCDLGANTSDTQKAQTYNYNNIIVLLIVKAAPKNFYAHFSCPLLGHFLDFGLLVWIWSSLVEKKSLLHCAPHPEFVMKAWSEIFRGIEWIKDKNGKGIYFTLVPPPPPLHPLCSTSTTTGVLHFMGINSYSNLHGKDISWTKDLSSPWESNSELPTQKAAHKPTMESLVLKLVLSTEFWGPNSVVWPFESKLLSSTFLWYCLWCLTRFYLFSLWMKSYGVTIQMKATEQHFPRN